ncbi:MULTISPECIES: putative copper homeostasis (lipo)protein LpqS [Nocardia]|uniref:hypothetical protein n=1 Tax=Nocardia TaxID=1817 RepID=UPI001E5B1AC8
MSQLRHPSVVALLMAVLLVAPTIDCALLDGEHHLHVGAATATASTGASHDHRADHAIGHMTDDCDQHMSHCIVKSVLPAGAGLLLPLLWLALVGAAAVGAMYLMLTGGGGVRGPPRVRVPVLNGQDILARFCIARR